MVLLALPGKPASAANTEPSLALMRAVAYRAAGGSITLKIGGSFSFADAVQLGLPLNVIITQGQLTARFDLTGKVFTSIGGGLEQAAPGPGLIGLSQREITLVLPSGFSAGEATAQLIGSYGQEPIASNRLRFAL